MFVKPVRVFERKFVDAQLAQLDECTSLLRDVKGAPGFRTLGLPLYQSTSPHMCRYRDAIRGDSPVLRTRFGPLQEAVAQALEHHLGGTVTTHPRAALPGFHLFLLPPGADYPGGGPHFDLSHFELPLLPDEEVDADLALDACVSFTLPLLLPAHGGGLQQWALGYSEFLRDPRGTLSAYGATHPSYMYEYEVGTLYVYSGYVLHQIAPIPTARVEQRRVTYQGHCVRIDGQWTMFW